MSKQRQPRHLKGTTSGNGRSIGVEAAGRLICDRLTDARARRVALIRELHPKAENVPTQSSFVDPRSQARVAAQLAPVPTVKKRTYKAKPKNVQDDEARSEG